MTKFYDTTPYPLDRDRHYMTGELKHILPEGARVLWVLGAQDPEMDEIERVVRAAGADVYHASRGGKRIAPGAIDDGGAIKFYLDSPTGYTHVVFVEVPGLKPRKRGELRHRVMWSDVRDDALTGSWGMFTGPGFVWAAPTRPIEIDHHDDVFDVQVLPLGHSAVPNAFGRSSLGQVLQLLRQAPTPRQTWLGAMDENLVEAFDAAAVVATAEWYDGDTPIVELAGLYAQGAAHLFGGVAPDVYVEQARTTARALTTVPCARVTYKGLTGPDEFLTYREVWKLHAPDPETAGVTGEQYPLPALPLALLIDGSPGLSLIRRRDGVYAWRLQCVPNTPSGRAMVRAFLAGQLVPVWRPEGRHEGEPAGGNLTPYGSEFRGYAGGVVPPESLPGLLLHGGFAYTLETAPGRRDQAAAMGGAGAWLESNTVEVLVHAPTRIQSGSWDGSAEVRAVFGEPR